MSCMRCSETGLSTTTTSSGLLEEARTRPQLPSSTVTRTPLTVTRSRMACLPIIGLGALLLEHGIGDEEAGRLHVDDEMRVLVDRRHVAREHHADLVGKDLLAGVVDDAATVAIAVEAQADIGLVLQHRI